LEFNAGVVIHRFTVRKCLAYVNAYSDIVSVALNFVARKFIVALGLALQVLCSPAFADGKAKSKAGKNGLKSTIKKETGPEATAVPKSFERDQTQKLQFEPSLLGSPEDVSSAPYVDDAKAKVLREAIGKKQREIDRLMGLLEAGRQMLAEAGDNRSAQLKISGSLSLLETQIQRLKVEIDVLSGGISSQADNNSASGSAEATAGPAAESTPNTVSSPTPSSGIEPASNPDADYTIEFSGDSDGGSNAPGAKGNK